MLLFCSLLDKYDKEMSRIVIGHWLFVKNAINYHKDAINCRLYNNALDSTISSLTRSRGKPNS